MGTTRMAQAAEWGVVDADTSADKYFLAALSVARLPWSRLALLARIPGYLLWRLRVLAGTMAEAASQNVWVSI